ncbi:MAG: N-acetylmuramoyl-L-alanine amidase [Lentisphaeria bacterium]|nr:N-acetylmuramoyl-L-alanine amidase [Lentisphaeria bacterium]
MPRVLLTLLAVLTAVSLSAAPAIRQKKLNSRSYCHLYDLLTLNRIRTTQANGKTTAAIGKTRLLFEDKQRRFSYNGRRVELCFPLVSGGGATWMSVLDWQKTLRPLLYPATVPGHRVRTVFLDMGHGGKDPGAIGRFSKEKHLTLAIGWQVAVMLQRYGYKVVMSRRRDVQIPLKQVGVLQNRSKSDLFVSIHINSAANRKLTGIETYCLTPAGAPSSNGGKAESKSYPGNRFDSNNFLLAWHIQQSLLYHTRANDRGVKRARFAVLKDLNAPGVLVEVGFISNSLEERRLNQRMYQDKLARGIVAGIVSYSRTLKRKP